MLGDAPGCSGMLRDAPGCSGIVEELKIFLEIAWVVFKEFLWIL